MIAKGTTEKAMLIKAFKSDKGQTSFKNPYSWITYSMINHFCGKFTSNLRVFLGHVIIQVMKPYNYNAILTDMAPCQVSYKV